MGGPLYGLRRLFGAPPRRETLPDYIAIGRGTYGLDRNSFAGLSPDAPVTIGNYCSFGPEVLIFGRADHPTGLAATYPVRTRLLGVGANRDAETRGPVTIGHDVWVGARAMILSGVTIGNGAIVAAGAVVSRDVAPFTLVAGVPARPVRQRLTEAQIAALEAIAWWHWPEEEIRAAADLFYGPVDDFIAAARNCRKPRA
ncbi:MAG: CatB-related O-acetyltransferase [Alphaproteobacteria bacterium]|jgi:acetyltransferase-like isoleucine patch superfamily enzyme